MLTYGHHFFNYLFRIPATFTELGLGRFGSIGILSSGAVAARPTYWKFWFVDYRIADKKRIICEAVLPRTEKPQPS